MHSQQRGLVRDASVKTFIERLERQVAGGESRGVEGWIELRKGAAAKLTLAVELIVFSTGVLFGQEEEVDWSLQWTDTHCTLLRPSVGSPLPSNIELRCGNWIVCCEYGHVGKRQLSQLRGKKPKVAVEGLSDVTDREFLRGRISYTLPLLFERTLLVPLCSPLAQGSEDSAKAGNGGGGSRVLDGGLTRALARGVDPRLRRGVPLLTILADADTSECRELNDNTDIISSALDEEDILENYFNSYERSPHNDDNSTHNYPIIHVQLTYVATERHS